MTRIPPLISVLFPVRDGGEDLYEAIDSIVAQSETDFEVMAVDDGSTDGSDEVLAEWAARDSRVRVLPGEGRGIVAALETARRDATGAFIARMDADDVAHPTRFERQVELLRSDGTLAACGTLVEYFPEESVRDGARRYERWINSVVTPEEIARSIFVECPLAHPTFVLRADALEAVGGYRDRGWPEDYDLVLRLWAAGYRMGKVDEVLLRWREGPDRLSRTGSAYTPEAFLACKASHLRETLLAGERAAVIWGAGPVGKGWSKALRGLGVDVEAFVELDPRKIGQEIHGAPVLNTAQALGIRGPLHLAAVGQEGARERLASTLEGAGMSVLTDYVPVA